MKVLWLAPYPYEKVQNLDLGINHPAPWITELEKEISQQLELTILSCTKSVPKTIKIKKNGVQFIFCPSPRLRYDLLTFYRLRIKTIYNELLNLDDKFDCIHVHGTEGQYDVVAQRLMTPNIVSIQGIMSLYCNYYPHKLSSIYLSWILKAFYEKSNIKRIKNFICRTKWDTEFIRTYNPHAKIHSNWELIREDFFGDHNDHKSKNLLFLGGTNQFKGLQETLKCYDLLRKRGANLHLRICGQSSPEKVIKLIKRDRLELKCDEIEFTGLLSGEKLVEVFKDSLCLLHPSYLDNSPNSICEAQVSGLPVIASSVGGVPSLIENNVTGFLVERYDHIKLADNIIKLMDDEKLYEKISKQSQKIAQKRHERKTIVNRTMEIYKILQDQKN